MSLCLVFTVFPIASLPITPLPCIHFVPMCLVAFVPCIHCIPYCLLALYSYCLKHNKAPLISEQCFVLTLNYLNLNPFKLYLYYPSPSERGRGEAYFAFITTSMSICFPLLILKGISASSNPTALTCKI